jgi:DNA-binding CsgD family transcriptional regulator/ketosteroid isomerase-like protein
VSVKEDSRPAHIDLLDRWFDAFNAHDVDALCALTDPAVDFIPMSNSVTAPPGTTYHGRDGMRTALDATFKRFPHVRLDHGEPQLSGNRATVSLEFVLDDGIESPSVRAAVGHFRLSGGLIRRITAVDPERANTADRRGRAWALSPREREVLSRLAEGRTIPEIAEELILSPLTVRTHVRNAKDKLRARTTAHAVAIAVDEKALDV